MDDRESSDRAAPRRLRPASVLPRGRRLPVGPIAGALVLALLLAACSGGDDADDEDRPVSAPPRVSSENGETVVTLDSATRARAGLEVEEARAASHRPEVLAYGRVLDLTGLARDRGALSAVSARVERAHAALAASGPELERITALHADGRNASDKTLEEIRARQRADAAELTAATAELAARRDEMVQRWGRVVAGWLAAGSPELDRLLAASDRLVELTVPAGVSLPQAPAVAMVRGGGGAEVAARWVSAAPAADPRLQGASLLYTVPADAALAPGTSVTASLPAGPQASGVVVPASAVVWWQGKAWAYVEKEPGRYVRRPVATDAPLPDGWFASGGVTAGERIVVKGAQTLLSEEGRAAVHGSEG